MPKVVEDPFFSRPYEPSEAVMESAAVVTQAARAGVRKPTRPLPALLGGIRKG
jgi:hypothetical protein